ncbi:MlaD family protein [Amycolatopsis acidiphila]|uniref:MCE family protein n=1 Tax=Amycolatopsis acidiphila TaxID=715473 RepID=A0A558AIM9_9PSEU|nr:MlaD family protein [Amycolatopsis acidiphila]TVT24125.1 MCE family protein [Amycolatopsis acidiphila]UIJ57713.1 MlaD family protein [Amycolatopsis acidiphila]GHG87236.1 hypothetical protein GCM10017788_60720 [Amycolatopsis acidiphila]
MALSIRRVNRPMVGVIALVAFAAFMIVLFEKQPILTALRSGSTITAEFSRDYKLEPDVSQVKIAGTPVGVVSGVHPNPDGTASVSLKIDDGVREKLGSAPSAEIRPTTILGGKYYVSLIAGGTRGTFTADTIPRDRTRTPVEADTLLQALPTPARQGLQNTAAQLDNTLQAGATGPLRNLLADAPGTLVPAQAVAQALQGSPGGQDLTTLVRDLDATANVLTRKDGQLADVLGSLHTTTSVLARESRPLADTIDALPTTLRTTRTGVDDLGATLDRLQTTAGALRPTVAELQPLLSELNPVLAEARPLVNDLRPLLAQLRPVVDQLVPTSVQGTSVLNDLRGPVLDRVNGPIVSTIMNEWHGTAPKYPDGGGTGNTFYEELAYMVTHIDNATKVFDSSGHMLNFQPGVGTSSVYDLPLGLDQLMANLSTMYGAPGRPGNPPLDLNKLIDPLALLAPQQFASAQQPDPAGGAPR